MASSTLSRVVSGKVLHHRHRPAENKFIYPVFFVLINLDELDTLGSWLLGVNRKRLLSIHFKDYGDGREPGVWVRELLAQHHITDCNGPIWLQTFPRVLGYSFNPVSFWYCCRSDGSVSAIVAEVNNTFGGRHCYVLRPDSNGRFANVTADKRLYVSPFYPVQGSYQFFFNVDFQQPKVRINYYDEGQLQLITALWGKSKQLSSASLARALLSQPLLTLGIMTKIHWQALRLWLKRVPLFERPNASEEPLR
jgi:DUF1365 family protein